MRIIRDEFPCDQSEIRFLEKLTQTSLPLDYTKFLLQYNGGIPIPYYPYYEDENRWFTGIERFLSCGDLLLQKAKIMDYDDIDLIKEYDSTKYAIDVEQLLTIGLCQKGNVLLYTGEEEFGQVYFCSYLDGDGLVKSPFGTFSSLLDSLKDNDWDDIDVDDHPNEQNKIFQDSLFREKHKTTIEWGRFESVLKYYGDPNRIHKHEQKNVYQKYAWSPALLDRLDQFTKEG